MIIRIEIPEPLAGRVQDVARSRATSPEDYIVDAVSKCVTQDESLPARTENGTPENPLIGLLSDDPELADFLSRNAYEMRATLPMRTPRE